MSKVSIIIPMYNTAEFITDCLKSLQEQTYKDIEVIIVDDASTDESVKKVNEFSLEDNRIKLFTFDKRKGVGATRNYGVIKSTGNYIYFLDSDDYLPPLTIELLVKYIGENNFIRGRMRNTNLSSSFMVVFNGLFNPKIFNNNRYNLLKSNSATNYLFEREFIVNNELKFSEDVNLFTDLYFMIPAMNLVDYVPYLNEALYFRRRRNDPITNPSLNQLDIAIKTKEFLYMYGELKGKYTHEKASDFLDQHLLNFYRKEIVKMFQDYYKIDDHFNSLLLTINKINDGSIKKSDFILKRELKAIKSGNIKRFKRVNAIHHLLRDLREGLKTKRKFQIFLYRRVFSKLPIKKNLVFFESFFGKSYSDNSKYIYEYMINNNMNYKYVWSFEDEREVPGNPKKVKRMSFKYFYYLARAKYWVSNSRMPRYLDKRPENVYLQTWHGTPLKNLVFDIDDIYSADPNYKRNFYEQSRRWDFLNSANKYSSEIFNRAFKYNKELLEHGYPRNDILYLKNNKHEIDELKRNLKIPLDKKVILYAPTWRDDEHFARGKYNFFLKLNLKKMQAELGNEYVILLRTHYFIANALNIENYEGFTYDFSNYDDIAELYLVSDILITDYSSVFFDYANLKRPILFYTYDLEKYRDKLRGFYLDIESEVPGPLLMDTEDVISAIKNIDSVKVKYEEKYEEFYDRFCSWDNGKASEKTVKRVFK